MRQFSVCRVKRPARGRLGQLVVILQHDQLQDIRTRIVAPLLGLDASAPVDHLAPEVVFDGRRYRISFHKMATLDTRDLEPVGRLEIQPLLMRAVDLIFAGI